MIITGANLISACTVMSATGSLAQQLLAFPGMLLNLEASKLLTVDTGKVAQWVDTVNGYVFEEATLRHTFEATGWTPNGSECLLGIPASSVISSPDNADFAVGGDSMLVVMALQYHDNASFEVFFGNGAIAGAQGFRLFHTNAGLLQVFLGNDVSPGTGVSAPPIILTDEEFAVVAYGLDRDVTNTIYGKHGETVQRKVLTGGDVVDNDNPMSIGGAQDSTYRPEARWRNIAMYRRASGGFSDAEVMDIMALIAADAGL